MTLWLIIVLGMTASYYARGLREEAFIVRNYRENEQAKLYAMAGIHHALAVLSRPPKDGVNIDRHVFDLYFSELEDVVFDEGGYDVILTDEERKINVNYATRDVIRSLLMEAGIQSFRADSVSDAIIDWRDTDDLPLLNGAESDYYRSLPGSYSSKNALFHTMEELLLVRGITPEILYSEVEGDSAVSLLDHLTVYGKGKINLNTADRHVLSALPGVDDQTALFVEEGRKAIDYQPLSKNEFIKKVEEVNPGEGSNQTAQQLSRLIDTKSYHFTIESWGWTAGGGVERGIRVLVYRSILGTRVNLRILSWRELDAPRSDSA
jgi:general secretion pathway protein K